jgi:glycerophosphoryl diester phosphodiesterase
MANPLSHLYPHTPLILGHRGASAYAPENTLAAFRLALEQGADGVELDVTLSADGVPVVIHDDTVDRTTDGQGHVHDLTLAQLKQLEAGYRAKFGDQFAGERLPTLAEVFEALGARAIINVELKRDPSPDKVLAQKVVGLIGEHCMERRVIVSSFDYDNLRRVRAANSELPLGLLYDPTEPTRVAQAWLAAGVRAEAHHPYFRLHNALTRGLYRAHGGRVNVWTVDAEADLRTQMVLGADGLITNCPDVAVQVRQDGARLSQVHVNEI